MLVTPLEEIYKSTVEVTSFPPHIVASVMESVFRDWVDFLKNPNSPGYRLPHLGVIRAPLGAINYYIKSRLIPDLRSDPTPERVQLFRVV